MALASLYRLKIALGITDSVYDILANNCLDAASQAVKNYLHREIELKTYTHFFDGDGSNVLLLRQRPVISITSVNSDLAGFYGQNVAGFGVGTSLVAGVDFALKIDDSTGSTSKSGILLRTGTASVTQWSAMFYGTLLAGARGTPWLRGYGNIKVVYIAGYDPIPDPIQQATVQVASEMYLAASKAGHFPSSENLGDYSYSLGGDGEGRPGLAVMKGLLAPYKERVI